MLNAFCHSHSVCIILVSCILGANTPRQTWQPSPHRHNGHEYLPLHPDMVLLPHNQPATRSYLELNDCPSKLKFTISLGAYSIACPVVLVSGTTRVSEDHDRCWKPETELQIFLLNLSCPILLDSVYTNVEHICKLFFLQSRVPTSYQCPIS